MAGLTFRRAALTRGPRRRRMARNSVSRSGAAPVTLPAMNWSYPTAVRFGPGRIAELAEACAAAGISRPLFVTDPGVAPLPITAKAMDVLAAAGCATTLFAKVTPNPTESDLAAAVEAFRAGAHDGVVAFGGGSALDLGKLAAFMAGQTRPVWDFEDIGDWWTRARHDAIAPIVAVPTTAGTGSEMGRAGVVTNQTTHTKKVIFHPKMLPAVVIMDPELTVGMPPKITAGTGMDAFAHCLEAYCAPAYHPMSEGIAVEGMRLVKENLLRAYRDGSDLEARGHMMSAAAMGAVAFQKGLGGIHALSHPIGALYDTHHGTTNAVVMPTVLRFNEAAIAEKMGRLSAWLGLGEGFGAFYDYVMELRAALDIPENLKALGVDDQKFDLMAEMAVVDPTAGGNPVKLTAAAARALFEEAWAGA
jgi:alcohol dehydrogenase class IV